MITMSYLLMTISNWAVFAMLNNNCRLELGWSVTVYLPQGHNSDNNDGFLSCMYAKTTY